jgi:hypothetical protein
LTLAQHENVKSMCVVVPVKSFSRVRPRYLAPVQVGCDFVEAVKGVNEVLGIVGVDVLDAKVVDG